MQGSNAEGGETVRVSVTLWKSVYRDIKRLSRKLGIQPSAWTAMSWKVKEIDVKVGKKEA